MSLDSELSSASNSVTVNPDNTIDYEPDPWDDPMDRNHEDSAEDELN